MAFQIRWHAAEPMAGVLRRLLGGSVQILQARDRDERLELFDEGTDEPVESPPADLDLPAPLLALGWATIDADRHATELTASTQPSGRTPRPESALGARALVQEGTGSALVLLEPITEGRLAAALARRGEGPVCLYIAREGPLDGLDFLPRQPTALGRAGRLLRPTRPWGPFLLVVEST